MKRVRENLAFKVTNSVKGQSHETIIAFFPGKGQHFVPRIISSQSPIVLVQMRSNDWLEIII